MTDRNIFTIGLSKSNPDDKLSAMLAYVLERTPEGVHAWLDSIGVPSPGAAQWSVETQVTEEAGVRDLVLTIPGDSYMLVACKSIAEFHHDHLQRYASFLSTRREPNRTLLTLTKEHADVGESVRAFCSARGLRIVQQRWQEMAPALSAAITNDGIVSEFVDMLLDEKLVTPAAFGEDDWQAWNHGAEVLERLTSFVEEVRPALQAIYPALEATGRVAQTHRWVYTLLKCPAIELALGFWANASPQAPDAAPSIWAAVCNPAITLDSRKATAEAAAAELGGRTLWDTHWLERTSVAEVLHATDFRAQISEAAAFAHNAARKFQSAGYLPAELQLCHPQRDTMPLEAPPSGISISPAA